MDSGGVFPSLCFVCDSILRERPKQELVITSDREADEVRVSKRVVSVYSMEVVVLGVDWGLGV